MSSFKQSFPRKWFFEKRDWIVSDEVEDETEEMTEEELVAEEEVNLQNFLFFEVLSHIFSADGDSYSGCGGGQEGEHCVSSL